MRIGILTKSMDDSPAGIGRYTENLVENLIKTDKKNKYFFIHYQKGGHKFYDNKNEIIIKRYPWLPKIINDSLAFLFFDKYKLDLVHEVSQINFLFPTKFKTIITVHDLYFLISEKNLLKKFLLKILYKTIFQRVDRLITRSELTKKDIIKILGIDSSKIWIAKGGVKSTFRRIRKNKLDWLKSSYILFVGTLEPRKNLERLIKAFYKLKTKSDCKYKLVIAGKEGWDYQEIFNIITKLKFEKEIIFTGYVSSDKELIYLYNHASLFVFPSLYEGLGLPPLEAMACGCPVITSNLSSLPEMCGKAAYYIDPYNINQLSKAMEKVLKNKILRKTMISRGLQQVKKFTWKRCAKETLNVYNAIMS